MHKTTMIFFIVFIAATSFPYSVSAGELNSNLKILEPLTNKNWVGEIKAPDGSAAWEVSCRYETVWGGKAVKYTKRIAALDNSAEGFFYWDDPAKKIAFFIIENNGVFFSGFATREKNIVTLEGRTVWPAPSPNPGIKQSYDFRNTYELKAESEMVDSWFQNAFGPWRPGHVIEFHLDRSK